MGRIGSKSRKRSEYVKPHAELSAATPAVYHVFLQSQIGVALRRTGYVFEDKSMCWQPTSNFPDVTCIP